MLPEGLCVHATANRLRIRFPDRKGDESFFAAVAKKLADCQFVRSVQVNAGTGSLLLRHEADAFRVADYAAEQQMFTLSVPANPAQAGGRPVSQALVQQFNRANRQVKRFSDNALDLPETIVLILVGSGVYQLARGNWAAPAWYTCFWYGMNIFLKSQTPDQSTERD